MFKQQCYENSLILERQTEIKLEEGNISRAKITVKREKIDVEDPEFIEVPAIKDEVDHNIQIQEGTSLEDPLEDAEISMISEEEVEIKEDFDADIPQMEVRLEGKVLQEQDKHRKQDDAGEETSATQLHLCEICNKVFEQRDLLKGHVMNVHLNKYKHHQDNNTSQQDSPADRQEPRMPILSNPGSPFGAKDGAGTHVPPLPGLTTEQMPVPMPSLSVVPSHLSKMANEPGVLVQFLKGSRDPRH
ncbi:uncharacterized protein [Hetaerina americana]|uniref:uncharacterized protein n=1 Tax=Hetaerina americana TaxID=62018 RepID=UPI003A7F391A